MQTIHILSDHPNPSFFATNANQQKKALILHLYNTHLKDDPLFHFFYEPDLIIRISTENAATNIKKYLTDKNISFRSYAYPTPEPGAMKGYGEQADGIVMRHLSLFLPIFHAHAVAALSMNGEDHLHYMERVIHTMWNPRGYSRHEEGEHLAVLAAAKIEHEITLTPMQSKSWSKCVIS